MAGRPFRQIAWEIITREPDPVLRLAEADKHQGTVYTHVRVFNENVDMKVGAIKHRMQELRRVSKTDPDPAHREGAAAQLEAMRAECKGWILDRIEGRG